MPPAPKFVLDIEALLEPITPENPAGLFLRYNTSTDKKVRESVKLYDELVEARREEENARSQGDEQVGDWSRQAKPADWPKTIELASTLLRKHTKDLQVAAWLVEALGRVHGLDGIQQGLRLLTALTDQFWENLHPQGEEGDLWDRLDLRGGIYQWLDSEKILPFLILGEPIIQIDRDPGNRYSYHDDKRTLDFENLLSKPPQPRKPGDVPPTDQETLLKDFKDDGGIRKDDAQKYYKATRPGYHEELRDKLKACHELVEEFNEDLRREERFGKDAVVLSLTLDKIEVYQKRVEQLLRSIATEKARQNAAAVQDGQGDDARADESGADASWADESGADESGADESGADESWADESGADESEPDVAPETPPPPRRAARSKGGPIADADDAALRVAEAAAFLRQADPGDPAPYLVLAALRMGESYRSGGWVGGEAAPAPPTEARKSLRRMALDGQWAEALAEAERSLARPEGQGWLDAHRLAIQSLAEQGYEPAARAALAMISGWLTDQPDWPSRELDDGTRAAHDDTRAWAANLARPSSGPEAIPEPPPPLPVSPLATDLDRGADDAERPIDPWDQARELVAQDRLDDAIRLLAQAARSATTGRERFLRKLQQAQVCANSRRAGLALPVFEELARQIDAHRLEDWEESSLCGQVFAGLYRCLKATQPDRATAIYARLCQLDFSLALACSSE